MNNCKPCQCCLEEKSLIMFCKDNNRKDKLASLCRVCQNKKYKEWYGKNVEKNLRRVKEYSQKNKEKIHKYRQSKHYKDIQKNYMQSWRRENKDKLIIYKKRYHKENEVNNPCFRILHSLRGRLLIALKDNIKQKHTVEFIGCSIEQLKNHLESKFKGGMTWDNYGRKGWHIDHIKPCSKFDLSKLKEQEICFHFTNLQPLWWHENCLKGDSYLSCK